MNIIDLFRGILFPKRIRLVNTCYCHGCEAGKPTEGDRHQSFLQILERIFSRKLLVGRKGMTDLRQVDL